MKQSSRILINPLLLIIVILVFNNSCKKEEDNNNPSESITDKDGNVYTSVTIGSQVWMVENLKTTRYNDGTAIPNVTDNTEWANMVTGAYCWYNNEISHKTPYGAMYNLYAVNTGKLCPAGWHVPSDNDWTKLFNYAGGLSVAGGKLKEKGTAHWINPNTGATDEYGFKYLPGGLRAHYGAIYSLGIVGDYWGTSQSSAWSCGIINDNEAVSTTYNSFFNEGVSVRCIKD
jgi:uncharacterized protein (TIGR02145 family)